jgi:hypothetical protein
MILGESISRRLNGGPSRALLLEKGREKKTRKERSSNQLLHSMK